MRILIKICGLALGLLLLIRYREYRLLECFCDNGQMICHNRYFNEYVDTGVTCHVDMSPVFCWFYQDKLHSLSIWNFEGIMYTIGGFSSAMFFISMLTSFMQMF